MRIEGCRIFRYRLPLAEPSAPEMNVRPVVSACYESGVGVLAGQAGLDTYRWLGADVDR